MIDWSRIRTLDQLQVERDRLERQVAERQQLVEQDVRQIRRQWQGRMGIARQVFRVLECLIPKPKHILSTLLSALLTRLLRRRR